MHNPVYLSVAVAALCGLWFLWDVALKSFFLDLFREEIFRLRFELIELGASGAVPFESDTYRSLETLLNGLLRYGHRITFMTWIYSRYKPESESEGGGEVDLATELDRKISRVDPSSQGVLRRIVTQANTAVLLYLWFTSLLFLAAVPCIHLFRALRLANPSSRPIRDVLRRDVGDVLESEVYREMSREMSVATAA